MISFDPEHHVASGHFLYLPILTVYRADVRDHAHHSVIEIGVTLTGLHRGDPPYRGPDIDLDHAVPIVVVVRAISPRHTADVPRHFHPHPRILSFRQGPRLAERPPNHRNYRLDHAHDRLPELHRPCKATLQFHHLRSENLLSQFVQNNPRLGLEVRNLRLAAPRRFGPPQPGQDRQVATSRLRQPPLAPKLSRLLVNRKHQPHNHRGRTLAAQPSLPPDLEDMCLQGEVDSAHGAGAGVGRPAGLSAMRASRRPHPRPQQRIRTATPSPRVPVPGRLGPSQHRRPRPRQQNRSTHPQVLLPRSRAADRLPDRLWRRPCLPPSRQSCPVVNSIRPWCRTTWG